MHIFQSDMTLYLDTWMGRTPLITLFLKGEHFMTGNLVTNVFPFSPSPLGIFTDPSLKEAPGLAGHNIKVFLGTTDKTSSVSFPLVLSRQAYNVYWVLLIFLMRSRLETFCII